MRISSAKKLIGQRVVATTLSMGEYVGILLEARGSPWRASIRVTGMLRPPPTRRRGKPERSFRIGQLMEVGGVCCKAAPPGVEGGNPLDVMRGRSIELQRDLAMLYGAPEAERISQELEAIKRQMDDEEERHGASSGRSGADRAGGTAA